MSRVAHLMTPAPLTVATTATAADAGRTMASRHLRHLPVVDADGRLVGILSDRDLRGPLIGGHDSKPAVTADTPVTALMTPAPITAGPDDDVGTVARVIVEHRVSALPVIDADRRLVGILSVVDVLRRLADEADEDARAVAMIE